MKVSGVRWGHLREVGPLQLLLQTLHIATALRGPPLAWGSIQLPALSGGKWSLC